MERFENVVFVTLPILYKVETEKRQETQRQDKPALTDSRSKAVRTAATSQEETTPVNETRQIAETTSITDR